MDLKVTLCAALIPLVVGFIWYNPKVFGNAWMKSTGLSEDKLKGGNMLKIFGLCYVFAFMLAMFMPSLVIHQFHIFSLLIDEPGFNDENSEIKKFIGSMMAKYGNNFRSFKHGALHGTITGVFFVMPIIGTISLFERRSFKYAVIHVGYWVITLALMGGVVCQFAKMG
jgi:Protein of unknown function (DUF1761)